jgi:O-antigen ligase
VVVLALAVGERAGGRPAPPWRNVLALPVGLLLLWTAVSALASPDPSTSVFGARESLNGVLTTVVLAVLFFAAAQSFDRATAKTALSVLFLGGGGVVLAYGGLQLADRVAPSVRLDPVPWVSPFGEKVIWSTLGNPNDLAGFLAVILPLGLTLLLLERRPALRALIASMLTVLVVELLATTSRGGVFAAVAAVVVVSAWLGPETTRRARGLAVAGGVAAVAAGVLLVAGGHTERGVGDLVRVGQGTTASVRVELSRTAWAMAADEPVFGVGPDGFAAAFDSHRTERWVRDLAPDVVATDAHNLLFTAMATQGFPGLLALSVLLGAALVLIARARRRLAGEAHALLGATSGALLAYVVQGLFNRQDVVLDFCFWVLLGLACALARTSGAARPEQGGKGDDSSQRADDEGDPRDRAISIVSLV